MILVHKAFVTFGRRVNQLRKSLLIHNQKYFFSSPFFLFTVRQNREKTRESRHHIKLQLSQVEPISTPVYHIQFKSQNNADYLIKKDSHVHSQSFLTEQICLIAFAAEQIIRNCVFVYRTHTENSCRRRNKMTAACSITGDLLCLCV